jgi:hypothetical protein
MEEGERRKEEEEKEVKAYRRWRKAEGEEEEERSGPNTGPIPCYHSKVHEKQIKIGDYI